METMKRHLNAFIKVQHRKCKQITNDFVGSFVFAVNGQTINGFY